MKTIIAITLLVAGMAGAAVVVLLLFLLQRMAPDIKMTIGHK